MCVFVPIGLFRINQCLAWGKPDSPFPVSHNRLARLCRHISVDIPSKFLVGAQRHVSVVGLVRTLGCALGGYEYLSLAALAIHSQEAPGSWDKGKPH